MVNRDLSLDLLESPSHWSQENQPLAETPPIATWLLLMPRISGLIRTVVALVGKCFLVPRRQSILNQSLLWVAAINVYKSPFLPFSVVWIPVLRGQSDLDLIYWTMKPSRLCDWVNHLTSQDLVVKWIRYGQCLMVTLPLNTHHSHKSLVEWCNLHNFCDTAITPVYRWESHNKVWVNPDPLSLKPVFSPATLQLGS